MTPKIPNLKEKRILSGNLAKEVKIKGYKSIRQFAEENDLPLATIQRISASSGNPKFDTLVSISKALKINLERLFRD